MTVTSDLPDTAEAFASHVRATATGVLAPEVVRATSSSIADTLACMAAGSRTDAVAKILTVSRRWGGSPSSTLCGHEDRLPAYLATFVNASMVHQHDFDDTHDSAVCHPTSASLPAALAVAEERGGVSGETLLRAVAVGNDIACRLAASIRGSLWDYPWIRAPFVGIFGAVAAAGLVAELSEEELRNAFGLALPQVASTLESVVGSHSDVRSIRDGLIYKDAVLAVELAAAGMKGDVRVFDGPYGFFHAYHRGEYDRDVLTADLGRHYRGVEVSLKPWPSCRHTHATLTAVLELLADTEDEVDSITVRVGEGNIRLTQKPWPASRIDALCHLPFVVATAAAHRAVPLAAFDPAALADDRIRALADKITWVYDDSMNSHGTIEPGDVELTAGGHTRRLRIERALGHPTRPMDRTHLEAKIADCLKYAVYHEANGRASRLVDAADGLAQMAEATEVWAPLRRG